MTDLRKAAEMALEFVDWLCGDDHSVKPKNKALDVRESLRQALAQPEQEPMPDDLIASYEKGFRDGAKREWVGLTDEDFNVKKVGEFDVVKFAKYIETLLKERNFGSAD